MLGTYLHSLEQSGNPIPKPMVVRTLRKQTTMDPSKPRHRKSRLGCSTCKIRKVKCDEKKPQCKQCRSYGTVCSYSHDDRCVAADTGVDVSSDGNDGSNAICTAPRRQRMTESSKVSTLSRGLGMQSEREMVLDLINSPPSLSCSSDLSSLRRSEEQSRYRFTIQDMEILQTFHNQTVYTLGVADHRDVYRRGYEKLMYSHPFLLHIAITLTLQHIQHYAGPTKQRNAAISFHYARGVALLNSKVSSAAKQRKLHTPERPPSSELDAMWACAGLLGALAFSSITASEPADAWPLKPPSTQALNDNVDENDSAACEDSDLNWLTLVNGKREIWNMVQPIREDSFFQGVAGDWMRYSSESYFQDEDEEKANRCSDSDDDDLLDSNCRKKNCELFIADLKQLYQIDSSSDMSPAAEMDVYTTSLRIVSILLPHQCTPRNLGAFLSFFGKMTPEFRQLLEQRDPKALLLLAVWYAKLCDYKEWWVERRAAVEGAAVYLWLLRWHRQHESSAASEDDVEDAVGWERCLMRLRMMFEMKMSGEIASIR